MKIKWNIPIRLKFVENIVPQIKSVTLERFLSLYRNTIIRDVIVFKLVGLWCNKLYRFLIWFYWPVSKNENRKKLIVYFNWNRHRLDSYPNLIKLAKNWATLLTIVRANGFDFKLWYISSGPSNENQCK